MPAAQPPSSPALLYVTAESLAEGAAAHVHVNEIMAGLVRRGWHAELIEPAYDKSRGRPGIARRLATILGVNWRAWRRLGTVDAIYCRANPLLMPVAMAARWRGVTVVQESNGPYADIAIAHPWTRRIIGLFIGMQRWQYRNADGIVTVTEQLASWLRDERGRPDVKVVPNGANTDLFTDEVVGQPPRSGPYVAFWGALAAWHGVDTMLAALDRPEWPAGVGLVVIGAGAESPKIEAAVAAARPVTYLGRQPYREIPRLVRNALAGLVIIEDVAGRSQTGSALKLYETLAAGLPAIVTDYPGQAELVRASDSGLVIPPKDPAALARAAAALAHDPMAAQAMGKRGRIAVVRDHSWDQRAGEVDALLRRLVRGGQ